MVAYAGTYPAQTIRRLRADQILGVECGAITGKYTQLTIVITGGDTILRVRVKKQSREPIEQNFFSLYPSCDILRVAYINRK